MKYYIKITEILQRVVTIDADTLQDAISKVEDAYANGQIKLDDSHFHDFTIEQDD